MVEESFSSQTGSDGLDDAEAPEKGGPAIRKWILLLIPVVLVILVYANTLHAPFIFDDIPNILDNPAIRLSHLSIPGLLHAGFDSPSANRPVANISFALNYLTSGYSVVAYHCINILVHVATGLFFYLLAAETLRKTGDIGAGGVNERGLQRRVASGGVNLVALAAATLWMIHPLQTQSVTYIVQRMNSLSAMFYLLSMLLYVRSRKASKMWTKAAGLFGAALSGVLAVGSKEIAITLPFFLFLYEWFFFQDLDPRWLWRQRAWVALLFVAAAGILFLYLGENPLGRILGDYGHRDFSLLERLLTQPRVVLFYLGLLVFPHPSRLNLDHDMVVSHTLLAPPATLVAIVTVTAIFLWALVSARRHRLLSFALLWYLGNLVIESSVIGLELVFEHRTYLPSMFLFLALMYYASHTRIRRRVKAVSLIALVVCLGYWTNERNLVWQDDLSLWQDCAEKSPQKPRPNNKLGYALEKRGRLSEAERQYRRVIALDPAHPYAYANLAHVLARTNRSAEAIDNYQKSLVLVPGNDNARINLGVLLARTGRYEAALEQFSQVPPGHRTDYGTAQKNFGLVLMKMGRFEAALLHFDAALALDPDNVEILYSMGNALYMSGRITAAIGRYRAALRYDNNSPSIHNNLGIALMANSDPMAAAEHFKLALALEPENGDFKHNLEIATSKAGAK